MRKLIPLLAIVLMAGPALVASGLAATYTDNFNGTNPQQTWSIMDEAGDLEVWTPGGLVYTAGYNEFDVSYGGMAHIVDADIVDPLTPLFLGSILASGTTFQPIPYSGGVTVHGRVNAGSILTGHGLALAAMFGPGDTSETWNFYTMNIAPWWHDISIGCYHNTTTWFRLDDWSEPVTPGVDMWTNPIDLTMQVQAMPNGNVSFVGVAYGDLDDGLGYRQICELSAEVGATIPDQYQINGVSQSHTPEWTADLVPKLTAGGVGFGGGVGPEFVMSTGQGQNVTFDNFQSWDPLPGDANLDGVVDDEDASALGKNWLVQTGATWFMGDFSFDGKVDDEDAAILAAHYGQSAGVGSVPEPSTAVLLLGLALAGLAAWQRR